MVLLLKGLKPTYSKMVAPRWCVARALVCPLLVSSALVNNHTVQGEIPNLCAHVLAPATLLILVCFDLANSY